MKLTTICLLIGWLICLANAGLAADSSNKPAIRPNVLLILTDDQRWDCVSINPAAIVATPAIESLARQGAYFKNHFCTTSLCSPSRASILSGLYAHSHGVTDNFTEYPDDMPTWPKSLQTAGYQTAYIGKYHMGEDNDNVRGGFDWFVTHKGQGKYFDTEFRFHGGESRVVPGYYTTVVTDLALEWLKKQTGDKPWAMIVGHKAPHSFYIPEQKYEHAFDHVNVQYPSSAFALDDNARWYKDRLDTWHGIYGPLFDWRKKWPDRSPESVKDFAAMTRAYWGTILSVDDSVERMVQYLRETEQLDNTLVIFTSDNGLLNGEHGMIDKRTAHEASMRIPLVVRYPKLNPPSNPRVVDEMTLTVDLLPSILDVCDVPLKSKVHGRSWKKLAQGESDDGWRESFLYHYNYEKQFPYTPNVRAVRTREWKYIRYPHGDGKPDRHKPDLFHIARDPQEMRNLADDEQYANVRRRLDAELTRLLEELGANPDKMPLDEGVKQELPDPTIR